jgi:hypothetical protein
MDKEAVANKLARLDDKVDRLQEPITQAVDAISALINDTNGMESADLVDFKIKLLEIVVNLSEKMAKANDEIIEDCENIDRVINKL